MTSRHRVLVLFAVCALFATAATAQDFRAIQDRLEITDHLTQYSYRWDSKDSSGFAELFTDDGIMERRRAGRLVDGSRVVGRHAILGYAKLGYLPEHVAEDRRWLADRQACPVYGSLCRALGH